MEDISIYTESLQLSCSLKPSNNFLTIYIHFQCLAAQELVDSEAESSTKEPLDPTLGNSAINSNNGAETREWLNTDHLPLAIGRSGF